MKIILDEFDKPQLLIKDLYSHGKLLERCLVEEFYLEDSTKPPALRGVCMVSCPCSKCSPYTL